MNANEVRKTIYEIVKMYFSSATIVWKETNNTVRKKPYIVLKMLSTNKATHSTKIIQNNLLCSYKQSKSTFEVNLYTDGDKIVTGEGMTPIYDNTAVADLEDFCNFLESERIRDLCFEKNITILEMGDVRDVTALVDGLDHEYRALAEFEVYYTQEVTGAYGVSNSNDETNSIFKPTPSGGRTEEQIKTEIGYFEKVVTESEDI